MQPPNPQQQQPQRPQQGVEQPDLSPEDEAALDRAWARLEAEDRQKQAEPRRDH